MRELEQPPPEDPDTVRIRAYDLRSNAQEALFRVQMLTDDETLSQAAEDVLADITFLARSKGAGHLTTAARSRPLRGKGRGLHVLSPLPHACNIPVSPTREQLNALAHELNNPRCTAARIAARLRTWKP
ncbi:hypothetical protein [Streptomyces sp. NPDC096152]|uniref:hypothetical protein n=1 Tax=Streptomyces sp. NPDC096152 TaxID=3366078 RepID=UPI0037FCBC34